MAGGGLGRFIHRRALRRGFLGGSRGWTAVATLGIAMRVLRRITRDGPEVVYSEELRPGESLLISHDRGAKVVRRRR